MRLYERQTRMSYCVTSEFLQSDRKVIIERYQLPSSEVMREMSKDSWKLLVKKQIRNFWTNKLQEDLNSKVNNETLLHWSVADRFYTPSMEHGRFKSHGCPTCNNKITSSYGYIHTTGSQV